MREWLEDLFGAIALFAIGYGMFMLAYGFGG
jgi:hypothetical protein